MADIFAVMVKYITGLLLLLAGLSAPAQTAGPDSLPQPPLPDSLTTAVDTLRRLEGVDPLLSPSRRDTVVLPSAAWRQDSARYAGHPYFRFTGATRYTVSVRQWEGKETIFYSLIALLIFFALIRNGFYRYLQDLFRSFFRTTVRQRQIKEQLLQSPLPSLLLNVFFVLSIGMFAALAFQHFGLGQQYNFWVLYLYCVLALGVIYGAKYLVLKFVGWILQAREVLDTYIFVVFTANKVMGIALLPFLLVLAFSQGQVSLVVLHSGLSVVGLLFAYRFFLSWVSVQRQVKMGFFHFALYLAALELAPLLLINKLLFEILS
jgi:hypothetical protein